MNRSEVLVTVRSMRGPDDEPRRLLGIGNMTSSGTFSFVVLSKEDNAFFDGLINERLGNDDNHHVSMLIHDRDCEDASRALIRCCDTWRILHVRDAHIVANATRALTSSRGSD